MTGLEPAQKDWKSCMLPLHHIRDIGPESGVRSRGEDGTGASARLTHNLLNAIQALFSFELLPQIKLQVESYKLQVEVSMPPLYRAL